VLEQVRRGLRSGGDRQALRLLGAFSRLLGGAFAFLLGALPFEFCGALPLAVGGEFALALGGALPGLLRGTFLLLPRAFLPLGAFLFPSGGALPLRGMPIPFRAGVAPHGVIRPCSAVQRCAFRRRVAIGLHAGAVDIGDRDRPGRGQAWQRRRIVIRVRPTWGR
jgi:hypothetical protein